MAAEQIQLWTDSTQSNFAMFVDSNFMVKINEKVTYVPKIAETSYMTGYDLNGQYILAQWIIYYFSAKYLKRFGTSRFTFFLNMSFSVSFRLFFESLPSKSILFNLGDFIFCKFRSSL